MNGLLTTAIEEHNNGNLEKALSKYQQCMREAPSCSPLLYQNLGALLRADKQFTLSIDTYKKGLKLFPGNVGILTNLANVLRTESPSSAVSLYLKIAKTRYIHKDFKKFNDVVYSLLTLLSELGLDAWGLQICLFMIKHHSVGPHILLHFSTLILKQGDLVDHLSIVQQISTLSHQLDHYQQAELQFCLASLYLNSGSQRLAHQSYTLARTLLDEDKTIAEEKRQEAITIGCWNFSNTLLRHQYFKVGWRLYDFGLLTPASGKQRWQRSLPKPFDSSVLPMWSGQSLSDKSLLILDEQAIGDGMQFLTLIPTLLNESKHLGLFLSQRLIPIYNRTYSTEIKNGRISIWSKLQAKQLKIDPSKFDFQIPLGSICQYRFTDISDYAPVKPSVICDTSLRNTLRTKYLNLDGLKIKKVIGISWRGGSKGIRMQRKSIVESEFSRLFSHAGILFVSLQYGQSKETVDKWRSHGFNVYHDSTIDPLKDMDRWLSQVAACDAVISVANTTVHGAGSLNIPTMCLLSQEPDWRWFLDDKVRRSYWYSSVGIARQCNDSWDSALNTTFSWIANGTPMPVGPSFTSTHNDFFNYENHQSRS